MKKPSDSAWMVFLTIAVVGGLLVITYFVGGRQIIDWAKMHSWEENICQVDYAQVRIEKGGGRKKRRTHSVDTQYQYVVGTDQYTGTRYDLSIGKNRNPKRSVQAVNYLNANPSLTCYFNPKNPSESIIDRSLSREMFFILIPIVLLALFGTLFVRGTWMELTGGKKRGRRRSGRD